ncbi:FAD-dependent oxidoreductase [Candidatus Bathyarchaeota archaeon]|nr:FAD-dependent oxidoreductase [Candidatus Bathyarchaeota archaeon]
MSTDILIIGAGPAGLQAAIHAARSRLRTVLVGKVKYSGLARAHIDNYCCIDGIRRGLEFLKGGIDQAARFGAEILEEEVLDIVRGDGGFNVETDSGLEISAKTLIFATGTRKNRLGVKGESEYVGRGVSYCVECDANFFKGKKVAVIGDGSAAASGAVLLAAYAEKVYLVSEDLDVSDRLRHQLESSGVELLHGKVKEIQGGDKVERLILEESTVDVDGVFIELGQKGAVELASKIGVNIDGDGFIVTGKSQETNIPGVFAAGDVCGPPFQVAKAVGEGCVAALSAVKYLKKI